MSVMHHFFTFKKYDAYTFVRVLHFVFFIYSSKENPITVCFFGIVISLFPRERFGKKALMNVV
ncbi:hypothetical protein AN957_16820 [Cytobacillus solani]|uniref:Uncharacterized protein n=1 Tax=Cytobacillus solani TaxID=1637975 RepID=A0A0Q3QQS1_9BACI|nr:hypothetical protein AMS60_11510 [Bacillus sp. FJAT-21945]KQL20062.1 hypothetical protein AN957_16820 [Cytobacillus solani]